MWLSARAASRLCAAVTACRSPVKCRLMRADGSRRDCPPPVPPPFWPNTGPSDGSRSAQATLMPSFRAACVSPTVQVVLPSPAGVGLIADTRISRARGWASRKASSGRIFRTPVPQGWTSALSKPKSAATSAIGLIESGNYSHAAMWLRLRRLPRLERGHLPHDDLVDALQMFIRQRTTIRFGHAPQHVRDTRRVVHRRAGLLFEAADVADDGCPLVQQVNHPPIDRVDLGPLRRKPCVGLRTRRARQTNAQQDGHHRTTHVPASIRQDYHLFTVQNNL